MSLKKLKRRLSWTFSRRQMSVDEGLSELTDQMTIEENGGISENGLLLESLLFTKCLRYNGP